MLAQNFKTAADLEITEAGLGALIKILGMLERGDLIHTARMRPIQNGFNMDGFCTQNECGTVACIAGWASIILGGAYVESGGGGAEKYGELIMPQGYDWSAITTEQAASALRNFLTLGAPCWEEVITAS